ncbi:MAG: hypothetical protein J7L26_04725 [Candidatus Aminicenantes bacterium]|nr:hypothetical protein [Candidatus Aminicenantes bacterium]
MELFEKTIKIDSRKDVVTIFALGDLHLASVAFDEDRFKKAVKQIKETPHSVWIGMGDLGDCIDSINDPRFDQHSVREPYRSNLHRYHQLEADELKKLLTPIAEKNIGLLCLSDDTLVLTNRGWKKYTELEVGDKVLSLNTTTERLEYKPIEAIQVFDYNGFLLNLYGKCQNQLVTPEHSVLIRRRTDPNYELWKKEPYRYVSAKDLPKSFIVPMSGHYRRRGGVRRTQNDPNFVELCGWIIAEGSFTKDGGIYIFQSEQNKDNIESILRCLKALKYEHSVERKNYVGRRRTDEQPWIAIYIKRRYALKIQNVLFEKQIPRQILNDWDYDSLVLLRETLLRADGHKQGRHQTFYTANYQLALEFLELCLKTGIRATLHKRTRQQLYKGYTTPVETTEYAVSLLYSKTTRIRHKSYCRYVGKVFDLTVKDNHNFVAMRDGKPFITGNCGNHEDKLRQKLNFDLTWELCNHFGWKNLSMEGMIRLNVERQEGHSMPLTIFAAHGYGGGRKWGGKINKLADIQAYFDADIFLMAHIHSRGAVKEMRLTLPRSGKLRLKQIPKLLVVVPAFYKTYQEGIDTYASKLLYPPSALGMAEIKAKIVNSNVPLSDGTTVNEDAWEIWTTV